MATALQLRRITAIRSALESFHQQHPTPGYCLVVSGGAYAPDTNKPFAISAANSENFVPNIFVSPPLPTTPTPTLCHHMVVPSGALPHSIPSHNASCFVLAPLAVNLPSRLPPTYPTAQDAFTLVVPSRFWLWHRKGIG